MCSYDMTKSFFFFWVVLFVCFFFKISLFGCYLLSYNYTLRLFLYIRICFLFEAFCNIMGVGIEAGSLFSFACKIATNAYLGIFLRGFGGPEKGRCVLSSSKLTGLLGSLLCLLWQKNSLDVW